MNHAYSYFQFAYPIYFGPTFVALARIDELRNIRME